MAYPQDSFYQVTIHPGSLIHSRRAAVAKNTLLYQLKVLRDTGRYDAFNLKWQPIYSDPPEVWPVPKHLFWDSDIAKWIEGACYFLQDGNLEPAVENEVAKAIKELVSMIQAAQQDDGYLNIHYTVVEKGQRFTNLRDMHELYNCGHLIEAALAHHALFRNDDLLGVTVKYVDLLAKTFGPKEHQIHGYPGHPEIELALLRLHKRTGETKAFELAKYFITERGRIDEKNGQFFEAEALIRKECNNRPGYWPGLNCQWYYQAHLPIIEQQTIEGHSVRAMYLLTAAADLVKQKPYPDLEKAIYRLWDNMTQKKMYLTGGIGAMKHYEGFGIDYFLPQGTDEGGCYAETCAAIGVMMLAERMLQIELDGKVADIMELALYNAVLTAMSSDGKKFTYVNQLASTDGDLAERSEWFVCACCPPNIMRLLGQIGGYVYTVGEAVNVHLFVSSEVVFEGGRLIQKSNWPWEGEIEFEVEGAIAVSVRIPGWAKDLRLPGKVEKGYLRLSKEWIRENPKFKISIPLRPRMVSPHPYVGDIVALARGPIVYCVEDVDNDWVSDHFKNVQLDPESEVMEELVEVAGDVYIALSVERGTANFKLPVFTPGRSTRELVEVLKDAQVIEKLHFVPYFFRSNRGGRGMSRVGLNRWRR